MNKIGDKFSTWRTPFLLLKNIDNISAYFQTRFSIIINTENYFENFAINIIT